MRKWILTGLCAAIAAALMVPGNASAGLVKKVDLPAGIESATARWSYPHGLYVVGNYFENWTFIAYGAPQGSWRWGWLGGDIRGCVWVHTSNLPAGGTTTTEDRCGAPRQETRNNAVPGYGFSFAPRIIWDNSKGNDGIKATLDPRACGGSTRRYANALPWLGTTQFVRPMGGKLRRPRKVKIRYLSRVGNDSVMVRDPELGKTGGYPSNWFFVPAACIKP